MGACPCWPQKRGSEEGERRTLAGDDSMCFNEPPPTEEEVRTLREASARAAEERMQRSSSRGVKNNRTSEKLAKSKSDRNREPTLADSTRDDAVVVSYFPTYFPYRRPVPQYCRHTLIVFPHVAERMVGMTTHAAAAGGYKRFSAAPGE